MLTKRIIACLDVRDGQVVKGVQFQELRHAGDPGALARRYNVEGIDEVVILDITATLEKRQAMARTIDAVAREISCRSPSGGIRSEDDAAAAVDAGADKVSLKHGGPARHGAHLGAGRRYGSQAVIVAIDARRRQGGRGPPGAATALPSTSAAAPPTRRATPSSGPAKPKPGAPARSC